MSTNASDFLLLDGATGTELERRGFALTAPLWSARVLIDDPTLLESIHAAYLDAGADAITTNTFRTHARNIEAAGIATDAYTLTRRAVECALRVRDAQHPSALVWGSVAPLGDCYTPGAAPSRDACHAEHGTLIERLFDAGVDAILLETMVSPHEAVAAAEAAEQCAPGRWMISIVLRSDGPHGRMLGGEPIIDLIDTFVGARAIGVNCASAASTLDHVRLLRAFTPKDIAVMAYANTDAFDASSGRWTTSPMREPDTYADTAMTWVDAGAGIIGGCCGTTPDTIAAMQRHRVTRSA